MYFCIPYLSLMKRVILSFATLLVSIFCFSQNQDPILKQYGQIWGYADASGKWVIMPQWWYASPFSEGYAVVSDNSNSSMYYFIDRSGKKCFNLSFYSKDLTSVGFKNGVAKVQFMEGGSFYYLTKDGKTHYSESVANEYAKNGYVNPFSVPQTSPTAPTNVMTQTGPTGNAGYSQNFATGVPAVTAPQQNTSVSAQNGETELRNRCLGVFVTYDYDSEASELSDKSGGLSVGLGWKEYFHKNVFTWVGLGTRMFFTSTELEDIEGKKYKLKGSQYNLIIPCNVGISFVDRTIELSTGPTFDIYLGSRSKVDGKVQKKTEEEKERIKKFSVLWDINFNIFSCIRVGLKIPLKKEPGVLLSVGIGF